MKTYFAKQEDVERNWWVIDASGKTLGRIATQVANLIRGKNKPTFTPHVDTGDFVVVVNADQIQMTGSKWTAKKYYRHSRHFGSLKEKTAWEMRESDPAFIIQEAVKGMLPAQSPLSRKVIKKLKVYRGAEHEHAAQKPQAYNL